jgi:benzoyl-CoA reductase/2-hydroxyglutaryl-CoA dehydratase subunit BcrC/BadD/HgdB
MRIGITTTVPIEIVFASGNVPVDLNNVFVSHPHYQQLIEEAELAGFPRNFCSWVKGIYGVVKRCGDIRAVIAVTQGDCSNTQALMETLQSEGIEVIPFSYPYDRDPRILRMEMEKLVHRLGTDWMEVEETTRRLDSVRRKVWEIDRMSYEEGVVSGFENHFYQVTCSDMGGDLEAFDRQVGDFLEELKRRAGAYTGKESSGFLRLGYIGVPPLAPELYDFLEGMGARVIYNEVQRQFTLPDDGVDLVERYLKYTYPYSLYERLEDIKREINRRKICGLIHYVQSFCFRQVEDILLRRCIQLPALTIELDRYTHLDARTRMRLENFVNVLKERISR